MRIRTIGVVAVLTTALFTAAGCPSGDPVTCDARPKPATCEPDGGTPQKVITDIQVIRNYLDLARDIIGKFDVTVVPADKSYTCKDGTKLGGDSQDFVACDDGGEVKKLLVPTDIQYAWGGQPSEYIIFKVMQGAAQAVPTYSTQTTQACAGAYAALKQLGADSANAGKLDRAVKDSSESRDVVQAASTGSILSLNGKRIKNCAG